MFAGKMFALIFVARTYFIAGKIAKTLCHTVSLVYLNFACFVVSLSLFLRTTIENRPVRRKKASVHLKFYLIACNTIEL